MGIKRLLKPRHQQINMSRRRLVKTHKRQTPSKLLGRQSLGGGISRFTPMEKGGGLKPALWSRGLWRRIKRQRRRGLERQEASSKRCWSQKENKREGPKKDGHRRRKDPWMRRRCDGRRAKVSPACLWALFRSLLRRQGPSQRRGNQDGGVQWKRLPSSPLQHCEWRQQCPCQNQLAQKREQLQYQNQLENLSLPVKRQQWRSHRLLKGQPRRACLKEVDHRGGGWSIDPKRWSQELGGGRTECHRRTWGSWRSSATKNRG